MEHKLKHSQGLYPFACLCFSNSLSYMLYGRYMWENPDFIFLRGMSFTPTQQYNSFGWKSFYSLVSLGWIRYSQSLLRLGECLGLELNQDRMLRGQCAKEQLLEILCLRRCPELMQDMWSGYLSVHGLGLIQSPDIYF